MENSKISFCSLPWSYLYLRYGGRVQPCCQNSTHLGDVNDKDFSFESVWNGEKLQEIRQLISEHKYEEAGCSKDCFTIHRFEQEKEINLFNKEILETASQHTEMEENLELLQKSIHNKDLITENLPYHLDVQPIEACNMSCIMCHQNHTNPTKLDTEKLNEFLTPLKKSLLSVTFQGGEIFVEPKYKDILIDLKDSMQEHQTIHVITNASLLSHEDLDRMTQGANPIQFTISADGIDEKTFKFIRQSSRFNKVMENIKYLAKLQKEKNTQLLRWNFVVMKSNFFQIKDAITISEELGIETNFQAIIGVYPNENIFDYPLINNKDALQYIQEAIQLSEQLEIKVIGLSIIEQKLKKLQ